MKAIIMAGGEGARLRPMTCDCPKPLMPLFGRPVMEYTLALLKAHGVTEAGVTLMYLPEQIQRAFGQGEAQGVSIRYYVEQQPLGTAGSVAQARDFLDETFLVMSGDGVTDCDLSAAIRFHRENQAMATLVLKHVDMPLEYGVVAVNAHGEVTRFVEKPGWNEVCADTVNTGMYILEPEVLDLIPSGQTYDFSKDLFPDMMRRGMKVCGFAMDGYWCDIGDVGSYLRAHMDALDGKLHLPLPVRSGCVNRMSGVEADRSAVLEGPCWIGKNVRIGEGARIGAYSVIGDGCTIGAYASVKRSVLQESVRLMDHAQVRGAVVMPECSLQPRAGVFEECVLGTHVEVGGGASVLPGVKVWPGKQVPAGTRLDKNLVWGHVGREEFRGDALRLDKIEDTVRAVRAYVAAAKPRSVLLCAEASAVAETWLQTARAALMACGVQVLMGGSSHLPQMRRQLRMLGAEGGCYLQPGRVFFLDERGIEAGVSLRRSIQQKMQQEAGGTPERHVCRHPWMIRGANLYYLGALRSLEVRHERQAAVCCPEEGLLELAESAFRRAGLLVRAEWEEELMDLGPAETGIWLEEDGQSFRIACAEGGLTEAEEQMLRVWTMLEAGESRVVIPSSWTHAAERLAEKYEAEVFRVHGDRSSLLTNADEESELQFNLHTDGIYAALCVLRALDQAGLSLYEWKQQMPGYKRRAQTVPLEWADRGRVLAALSGEEGTKDGWAWLEPSAEKPECCVVGEALSMEAADELCGQYVQKLMAAIRNRPE